MHSGDGRNSISPSRDFEVPEETCKKRHACRHPAIIGPAGKESFSDHRGGTGYTTCWERNTGIGLDNGRLKAERNWPTNQSPSILFVTRALPRGLETLLGSKRILDTHFFLINCATKLILKSNNQISIFIHLYLHQNIDRFEKCSKMRMIEEY